MKLLSYHIENYGKIHLQDGNFFNDVTCFCEKNGFGKSTLASFIKAMFYGLDSYTAASKGFNDRQHYYPFGGGKFGGNLTFEYGGKVYRIERFFDKKSAKGDECKVYENGAPCEGFGEEIGKALFGLDEESFKRTVFITSEEIEVASTHSINEKLNRTVEGVGDGYEQALGVLEKAKKSLKAARGNNDKISEKKREISDLTAQIKNLRDMSAQLTAEYIEREQLCEEIDQLEKTLKEETERNLVLQRWDIFDSMILQKERKEEELQTLRKKYPLGMPGEEESAFLQVAWENKNRLRGSAQALQFSLQKQRELEKLEEKFQNGLPMSELIEENQRKINRLKTLETERTHLTSIEESTKEKQLIAKYSLSLPTREEREKQLFLSEEYKCKEKELKERSSLLLQEKRQEVGGKTKKEKVFLLSAIALLLVGAGLLFVLQILGIALMAFGGVALIVGSVLKTLKPTMPTTNEDFGMSALQAETQVLEEKIRAYLVPYGYYSEAGVLFDLAKMEADVEEYETLLYRKEQTQQAVSELEKTIQALQGEVTAFLSAYDESVHDLQMGLQRLATAVASYQALQADKQEALAREQQIRESLFKEEARIKEFLKKYALDESVATMDGLNTLSSDIKSFFLLESELKNLEKELLDFQTKHHLTNRPQLAAVDLDDLRARLSKCRKALADCDKRIAESERFVEKTSEAENALLLAEEKLKEYKEKYELIIDTMEALKGAEQRLKDKYVAPIKERFSVYANLLEKVLDEKISMDQDFRIVFERGGEGRSDKHLSAGERSLCALCLRLALVDNMYENEKPFILMDDPFVHLDEEHLARTKQLIRALAQDKQIVYFCCHESRRV